MRKSRQPRAQRQRKEGPDSAGRQRRSCRRVTGASTVRELWHRIQRSTGRGGPANIRQQATVREMLNRLSDNSSPAGKKNEKKADKTGMAGSLWSLWNSSETDGSQEARLNPSDIHAESPPLPKRQGAGQIRPLCFVAERIVTTNRRLRPRSCGIPRLPRGLPAYLRSKSSR